MSKKLNKDEVIAILDAMREEIAPSRFKQLNELAASIREPDFTLPYRKVLSVVAGSQGDEASQLNRLRKCRSEIKAKFADFEYSFSLEVSKGKVDIDDKVAWFSGEPIIRLEQIERVSRQALGNLETGIYDKSSYQDIKAQDIRGAKRIFVSHSNAGCVDTRKDIDEFVEKSLPTALRSIDRPDLADSIWYSYHDSDNQMNDEIQTAIQQSDLGLLLCSQPFLASAYIREHEVPHFDPKDFEQHKRHVVGVLFEQFDEISSPTEANKRLGLDADGGGGVQWIRFDRDTKAYVQGNRYQRRKWVATIAKKIARKLAMHESVAAITPEETVKRETYRELEHGKHASKYREKDHFPVAGFPADLSRIPDSSPSSEDIQDKSYVVLDHMLEWAMDNNSASIYALLGEFGAGKTFTARIFAKKLLDDEAASSPLYIDLRDISIEKLKRDLRLETLLALWLENWRQGLETSPITVRECLDVIGRGAIVIFDGFDEISVKLNKDQDKDFLKQLLRVVIPDAENGSSNIKAYKPKVLITCRSHYFPTLKEQNERLLGLSRGDTQEDGLLDRGSFPERGLDAIGSILLPFRKNQVLNVFVEHLGEKEALAALNLIESVHDLSELASRPYLTQLITEQIANLEQIAAAGESVNAVTLYRLLVEDWLARDQGKHIIEPEHKKKLITDLAGRLWKVNERVIEYSVLNDWVLEQFANNSILQFRYQNAVDLLVKDMHCATFLVRDGDCGFRFAHSSMHEYFLAEFLLTAIKADEWELWDIPDPSGETLQFLLDAFQLEKLPSELWAILARWIQQEIPMAVKVNLLRFANLAVKNGIIVRWPNANLSGVDLSDWIIGGGSFNDVEPPKKPLLVLDNADFSNAKMRRTQWRGVSLKGLCLTNVQAQQSKWLACDLSEIGESDWTKVSLHGAAFHGNLVSMKPEADQCVSQSILIGRNEHKNSQAMMLSVKPLQWESVSGRFCGFGSVGFSPDGSQVLTISDDSAARLWDAHSGECVLTLSGHQDFVTNGEFSPDGLRVLTVSDDGAARLWDAHSGECVLTLSGHQGSVTNGEFSSDGSKVLTVSMDKTARLWDLCSGECVLTLNGHQDWVNNGEFSPDGSQVLTVSRDKTARLWDAHSGGCALTLGGHQDWVNNGEFSPDGSRVLTVSKDGTARLWDAHSGECVLTLSGHQGSVTNGGFSPDGSQVLTVSLDETVRLWDAHSGACVLTLSGHQSWVTKGEFSQDGSQVLTMSNDSTARLWDAHSGECVLTFSGHQDSVTNGEFSPDGSQVLTVSLDETARLWDARSGECVLTFSGYQDSVNNGEFSPDGSRVLTVSRDKTARLWDAHSGECVLTLSGHQDSVTNGEFSPDGSRVLTVSLDETVRLWDAHSGACVLTLSGHLGWVTKGEFSPDGSRVLTVSDDIAVQLWNAHSGECVLTLSGHQDWITDGEFSPDGSRVLTVSLDETVRLWDAQSGACVLTLSGHLGWVAKGEFSPDGSRVLTVSKGGAARLWDANSGECVLTLSGHQDLFTNGEFSPDGSQVLTVSLDKTVRLWDAHSGECVLTLSGHQGSVAKGEFSPDGSQVLTVSKDGTARLWDANSGECVLTLSGHQDWVTDGQFSPDGSQVLTVSIDGAARLFDLENSKASDISGLMFWHFPGGAASGYDYAEAPSFAYGSAWYFLRAYAEQEDGSLKRYALEDIKDLDG